MGQQQTAVAGSALRRMILVLAVAALMAALMAVIALPAMAKNDDQNPLPGPPLASGNERGAVALHCNAIGGQGTSVENHNGIHGNDDCLRN